MSTAAAAQTTALPRVLAVLRVHDSGEYGNTNCPHCGADGRYVYSMLCENGERRAAMAGCMKLFPHHRLFTATETAIKKAKDADRHGWSLASWYSDILCALDALEDGTIDQAEWERRTDAAIRRRDAYHQSRYGRRR